MFRIISYLYIILKITLAYWFLIRYQLYAQYRVRAVYYFHDPLISTSNPPTTHFAVTKQNNEPQQLESITKPPSVIECERFQSRD